MTHIFCLHFVYLPRINQALSEFVAAHNNHKVSTEKNKTPAQLFWCNIRLADYCQGVVPEHANQPDVGELMASHLPHAVVPETPNPLSEESLGELQDLVSSLSYTGGMFVYRRVVQFVGQHMLV